MGAVFSRSVTFKADDESQAQARAQWVAKDPVQGKRLERLNLELSMTKIAPYTLQGEKGFLGVRGDHNVYWMDEMGAIKGTFKQEFDNVGKNGQVSLTSAYFVMGNRIRDEQKEHEKKAKLYLTRIHVFHNYIAIGNSKIVYVVEPHPFRAIPEIIYLSTKHIYTLNKLPGNPSLVDVVIGGSINKPSIYIMVFNNESKGTYLYSTELYQRHVDFPKDRYSDVTKWNLSGYQPDWSHFEGAIATGWKYIFLVGSLCTNTNYTNKDTARVFALSYDGWCKGSLGTDGFMKFASRVATGKQYVYVFSLNEQNYDCQMVVYDLQGNQVSTWKVPGVYDKTMPNIFIHDSKLYIQHSKFIDVFV